MSYSVNRRSDNCSPSWRSPNRLQRLTTCRAPHMRFCSLSQEPQSSSCSRENIRFAAAVQHQNAGARCLLGSSSLFSRRRTSIVQKRSFTENRTDKSLGEDALGGGHRARRTLNGSVTTRLVLAGSHDRGKRAAKANAFSRTTIPALRRLDLAVPVPHVARRPRLFGQDLLPLLVLALVHADD